MPRIRVSGPAGSTIRLTHAEVLFPDGTINRGTCGGNRGPAYWQYTKATDQEETWFVQFNGTFRAAAEWGASFIMVPWQHYLWTGDTDLLTQYYPAMTRYLAYLDTRANHHILDEGLGDWYDLGPNKPGRAQQTPPEVTASAFYYYDYHLMAQMATLLGEQEDAQQYRQKAKAIRQTIRVGPVLKTSSSGPSQSAT